MQICRRASILTRIHVVFLLLIFSFCAWAESPQSPDSLTVEQKIVARLRQGRSDLNFTSIEKAPLPGFYQVQVERGPLIYVSEDGEHFFDGNLYQVRPGQFVNIRELALAKVRREILKDMDPAEMIVFKPKGETKAIMNVFTDVDCGYCRKLHSEMPELNAKGIEVRYLAFPRAGIGSSSYQKIVTAWCADDKQGTLTKLKRGEKVEIAVCPNNPVEKQYNLGKQLGVTGTPSVIFMDGTMIPGYQPADEFARMLGVDDPSTASR